MHQICFDYLPQNYATPLKRRPYRSNDSEEDQDLSIEKPAFKKSFSVPSTVDSPLLAPSRMRVFQDIDSSYELPEEELPTKCEDFHEKGYCQKGKQCDWLHQSERGNKIRISALIQNFPELMGLHRLRRVQSFLE